MYKALLAFFLISLSSMAFAEQYVWDSLRPLSDLATQLDVPVKWFLFILSIAILCISLLAYSKSRSRRILLVTFAFFIFALKAIVKILDLYFSPGNFFSQASNDVADFLIMLSIFSAVFYRKSYDKFFEKDTK